MENDDVVNIEGTARISGGAFFQKVGDGVECFAAVTRDGTGRYLQVTHV